MKDIHKLTDCINNSFKCCVVIIKKKLQNKYIKPTEL